MNNRRGFFVGIFVGAAFVLGVVLILAPQRPYMAWSEGLLLEEKTLEIFSILEQRSIVPFEREILIDSMFRGLLEGVDDPYSAYFNAETLALFRERSDGRYAGIGVSVNTNIENMRVNVVNVFQGTPADEAGLLPGDYILEVNGESVLGFAPDEVAAHVRGTPGTAVVLQILRGEDTFDVEITRQMISIPTVSNRMLNDDVGFLRIESFDGVTEMQFLEAYEELLGQGMSGLILDLRNNSGGLLSSVLNIGNLMLPEGAIMHSEDNRGNRTTFDSRREQLIEMPLVVLVNGASASASEVLTGAIMDHNRGTVVGEQTFGKGVVQTIIDLRGGSAIRVTVAEYFTPNGNSIHNEGITPHHTVEVDRETAFLAARLTLEEDLQLQKALEIISEKLN